MATTVEQIQSTPFDRLGGLAAIEPAVEILYRKLLDDPKVSRFFSDISVDRLKDKQVKFLSYALGGAENYPGDPAKTHRRLYHDKGVRVEHFYIVVGHVQDTLRELGVSEEMIAEITTNLAPMKAPFEDRPED